jgi:hypothetical protein
MTIWTNNTLQLNHTSLEITLGLNLNSQSLMKSSGTTKPSTQSEELELLQDTATQILFMEAMEKLLTPGITKECLDIRV